MPNVEHLQQSNEFLNEALARVKAEIMALRAQLATGENVDPEFIRLALQNIGYLIP